MQTDEWGDVEMIRKPTRAFAAAVGTTCSLVATLATGAGWSGRAMVDKIVVHADQDISVFKASEVNGLQEDWPNPDACDDSSKVILRPVRSVDGISSGVSSYEQAYAALLGAKLNGQTVVVFLNGCTSIGTVTFPLIEAVAIK